MLPHLSSCADGTRDVHLLLLSLVHPEVYCETPSINYKLWDVDRYGGFILLQQYTMF